MRVAIVALGPSSLDYVRLVEAVGNRGHLFDEVWAINGYGFVIQCDRIFHMDDVRIQEIRAAAGNKKIGAMLEWMKGHPGPIITSRAHPDYPGLVEYPLADVLNSVKKPYINSTVAAAICYAIHKQVTSITCFGMDFTYRDRRVAERGRACVEYWLGVATARGIEVQIPDTSSLLDACEPPQIYGYDTVDIVMTREGGTVLISFKEREDLPTAEQVEAAYDPSLNASGERNNGAPAVEAA